MKAAIVCGYPLNKIYTGSKIYVDKLAHHLLRLKDIELHIITVGKENRQFKKDNMIIHTIKTRKLFYIPFLTPILSLKRKIIGINPDVVHGLGTGSFYSTGAAFLRDRYPTVLTAYGSPAKHTKYFIKDYKTISPLILLYYSNALFSIINERYVLSKVPNIIVDTSSIKDLISKWTKSKIYVVPAGVEYDKIEEIQSHTLLNKSPDIFIVVNLEKIKGVDILIKSIPTVIKSIPNLSVYIAGSGPHENKLKTFVKRLNLENHVKFLGFISDEEKYQYYKACKIVVVPSRWDCQPAALFDAAASGKAVIASDMSNPEIVDDGKTGFIFESENVEDLVDKIITLLKDEKLREELEKAAKEKVKQYDWNKVAERYVEIYKEVIADFHEQKVKNKEGRKIV